ncbi:MAG: N-acetylmuramoyl-L-alanine amidase [Candidatus Avoscillospira sp.]
MPLLFLSPSTQEYNPYVTSGNEEYWMNLLADRMEPYLLASGIGFSRNDPSGSAAASIRQSNAGNYDFHLALHSNAAPPGFEGTYRGIDVYYYPSSADGLRMANILVDNLKPVYPLPDKVRALPTVSIGEVRMTNAPAVLAELGYHDNVEDALWIENNLDAIARALVLGVTEYFGVPFVEPGPVRQGVVNIQSGNLNIRNLPTTDSRILAKAPNGAPLTIFGESGSWYTVQYGDTVGFANTAYVTV